ncbi:hypothetical protein BX600DRAFT_440392 [Xylariales sp. PMI_506]|nr:hypothetical protein BX600DRAFT_440392 [Xylariales sp. PMI_506]
MNFSTANSLCLAPLVTAFQNEEVTVEQYFDILLAHVTTNGLTHESDNAGPRSRAALISLVTSDAVCGAFRIWTLNSAYPKLKSDDVGPLKQVLLTAWEAGDLPELQQRGISLANLVSSPQILQVLVAIAFCRQQTEPLERALALVKRPPEETIFDLMNLNDLPSHYKSLSIWDRVLRSGWIHPVLAGTSSRVCLSRAAGWASMVERSLTATDSADSTPVHLRSFLRALRDNSVVPTILLLCQLVEKGVVKADRMAVFCDVFPARRLKPPPPANRSLHVSSQAYSSPNALLRAASLSPCPQEEKCALLEVLLRQGLDPNWVPKVYEPTRQSDFRTDVDGWYQQRDETETALHVAVMLGEADVVRLLLHNKAKTNIKDGQGKVPLDRLNTDSMFKKEIYTEFQTVNKKTSWFRF